MLATTAAKNVFKYFVFFPGVVFADFLSDQNIEERYLLDTLILLFMAIIYEIIYLYLQNIICSEFGLSKSFTFCLKKKRDYIVGKIFFIYHFKLLLFYLLIG